MTSSTRLHRRHDQLLQRAALALARDGHGRQHHHGHGEDHAHEPGHDVHGRAQVGVVPGVGLDLDRHHGRHRGRGAACGHPSEQELGGPGPGQRGRGVGRAGHGLRIRAVDHQLQPGGATAGEIRAIAGRHHQGHVRLAAAQRAADVVVALDLADQIVEARGLHAAREVARGGGVVLIEHDRGDVPHVGVDRVAEEQELHDRQGHHHGQGQPVAAELLELLPGDDPRAQRHAALRSWCAASSSRTMDTNTSSTVARATRQAPTAMPSGASTALASAVGSAPPRVASRRMCP